MKSRSKMLVLLLGLGLMGSPLLAADQGNGQGNVARQAVPGTVNYVEGAVYLDGSQLNSRDVGSAILAPGQEISTGKGKAEILLTPGVFLRLDDNSTAKIVSPDLTLTQVELDKGRAGIEVDEIHDQNNLQMIDAGVTTRLNKRGYYEFDANRPEAMVFSGEAHVQVSDNRWREIKGHHELALNEGQTLANEKPASFNQNDAKDVLYNWNSLRSEYMAEANNQMAADYDGYYGGPGWYWDPWDYDYAYMGIGPFYSPFGWGFYPFGWGGYWGGYYGGHYRGYGYGHGYVGGGIHGGSGYAGGGFHGGGGFGGGGMGGGGHR